MCVCFLPIHSGHQVRWTYQPGSHRRKVTQDFSKALHGRLAGRFKPPLAGRCNDFAPSRQKNYHRQKQPSRPGPRKKKKTPPRPVPSKKTKKATPSGLGKKNNRPVPPRKKKTNAPSRLGKKKPAPSRLEKKTKPSRPAMNSKYTAPRVETGNKYHRLSLFLSFLLHIYIVL